MASRSRTPGHAQALYKVPPYSQYSRSCPVEIYIHIYIYRYIELGHAASTGVTNNDRDHESGWYGHVDK